LTKTVVLGIDLAGSAKNPTGWATIKNGTVKAGEIRTDEEIVTLVKTENPTLTAIDAPLSLPKEGFSRKADKEMLRRGYRVLPPRLPAMEKLTRRAIILAKIIREMGFRVVEVHPASTRKALNIPVKEWGKIQTILTQIGLRGEHQSRVLTPHEIDAVTAAITAQLHLIGKTIRIGSEGEGYIVVPEKNDWRQIDIWKHKTRP